MIDVQPSSTTWAERIRPHLTGAVEHILAAGRELNAAKEALPHGAFGPLLADLGLSRPMAHRFMTVANNPVLTSCSPVNTLPAAVSVLATLAQLDDDTLAAAIESGRITPSTTRADARQLVNYAADPFLAGKMDDLPVAARSPNGCSCMVCGRFGNVCLDYEAGHQLCSMCAGRVLKDHCQAIATSTPQEEPEVRAAVTTQVDTGNTPNLKKALQAVRNPDSAPRDPVLADLTLGELETQIEDGLATIRRQHQQLDEFSDGDLLGLALTLANDPLVAS